MTSPFVEARASSLRRLPSISTLPQSPSTNRSGWTNIAPVVTEMIDQLLAKMAALEEGMEDVLGRIAYVEEQSEQTTASLKNSIELMNDRLLLVESRIPPNMADSLSAIDERITAETKALGQQLVAVTAKVDAEAATGAEAREHLKTSITGQQKRLKAVEDLLQGGTALKKLTADLEQSQNHIDKLEADIKSVGKATTANAQNMNALEKALTERAGRLDLSLRATDHKLSEVDKEADRWRKAVDGRLKRTADDVSANLQLFTQTAIADFKKAELKPLQQQLTDTKGEIAKLDQKQVSDRMLSEEKQKMTRNMILEETQQVKTEILEHLTSVDGKIDTVDGMHRSVEEKLSARISESLQALKRVTEALI